MVKETKVKIVMLGQCPRCGKEYTRKPPIDATVCMCQNPDAVLVPLTPALLLPKRAYAKFSSLAELTEVDVDVLVNTFLEEAARQKLEEMKLLPRITVVRGVIKHEPLR
jgi:hypothetical protein